MMKPKFDDIIEYVRAGEDDPELRKLLDLSPDGKELLKQARFICRMLDREVGKDKRRPAVVDRSVSYDRVDELRTFAYEPVAETFSMAKRPRRSRRIGRDERRVEDLGTLEFAVEDERVALSYERAEQADEFISSFLVDSEPPKPTLAGIHIRGATIQLSLPEAVLPGEPLTVHLTRGARQMPASGQEAVFMPETGPFLKLRADEEGRFGMPVPEVPGTLRIDTQITELLRIRPKH